MNEIEQMFYDAYNELVDVDDKTVEDDPLLSNLVIYGEPSSQVIGIYKVDFVVGNCAIEIDGHEWHKTKEQREYDYKRERYLIKQGYTPVRFMGTEVYLDAKRCVLESYEIASQLEMKDVKSFFDGHSCGYREAMKQISKDSEEGK